MNRLEVHGFALGSLKTQFHVFSRRGRQKTGQILSVGGHPGTSQSGRVTPLQNIRAGITHTYALIKSTDDNH